MPKKSNFRILLIILCIGFAAYDATRLTLLGAQVVMGESEIEPFADLHND